MKKIYALLWVITFIIVPWRQIDSVTRTKQIARNLEYHFLFSPPKTYGQNYSEYKVDFTQLLLEWGALVSVGAVYFVFRRDRLQKSIPARQIAHVSEDSLAADKNSTDIELQPFLAETPRTNIPGQPKTSHCENVAKKAIYNIQITQSALKADQRIPNYGSANQKPGDKKDHDPEAIKRQLESWRKRRPQKRETPSDAP